MKEIMHTILFGFKEILTWNTMKIALIIGVLVSVFWAGVGFLFWDHIVSLGARVVELVPFSMVRSNGAWMLSAFFLVAVSAHHLCTHLCLFWQCDTS